MKPYYQDDYVTLYHGDCREIVPTLGKFDLLLTDPPYGIKAAGKTFHNKSGQIIIADAAWDDKATSSRLLLELAQQAIAVIIWGGNYYGLPAGRCWLVWDKVNDGRTYAEAELAWTNLDSVVRVHRERSIGMDGGKRHPTQKTQKLMEWCIGFVPDAQTILDPFAGSGTTGRAAKDLQRKCTLIELEERYCEVAANRLRQEVLPLECE